MKATFQLEISRRSVSLAIQTLAKLEGVHLKISRKRQTSPINFTKNHPSYHLDPASTAQIVITCVAASTALLAFATALLNLKKSLVDRTSRETKQASPSVVIVCNGIQCTLDSKDPPEKLAQRLQALLKGRQDAPLTDSSVPTAPSRAEYESQGEGRAPNTEEPSRISLANSTDGFQDQRTKGKVGILAFGSLISDPGYELMAKVKMRIKTRTPFGVEYGRISKTRGGAPTLVPHKAGEPVEGEILVLDDTVSVEEARNMLWRRERRKEGTGEVYGEGRSRNSVLVREWTGSPCVEHALYTDFHAEGKVASPRAADLAKRAIQSVKTAKEGMDGITYLKSNLAFGVKTKLSADYETEILKQTKANSLDEGLRKAMAL